MVASSGTTIVLKHQWHIYEPFQLPHSSSTLGSFGQGMLFCTEAPFRRLRSEKGYCQVINSHCGGRQHPSPPPPLLTAAGRFAALRSSPHSFSAPRKVPAVTPVPEEGTVAWGPVTSPQALGLCRAWPSRQLRVASRPHAHVPPVLTGHPGPALDPQPSRVPSPAEGSGP